MTDFDLWFGRVLVVATVGTYFGSAFYAAFALGGWVGAVLLAGLMVPPLVYALVNRGRDGGDGLLVEQTRPAAQQQDTSGIPIFRD